MYRIVGHCDHGTLMVMKPTQTATKHYDTQTLLMDMDIAALRGVHVFQPIHDRGVLKAMSETTASADHPVMVTCPLIAATPWFAHNGISASIADAYDKAIIHAISDGGPGMEHFQSPEISPTLKFQGGWSCGRSVGIDVFSRRSHDATLKRVSGITDGSMRIGIALGLDEAHSTQSWWKRLIGRLTPLRETLIDAWSKDITTESRLATAILQRGLGRIPTEQVAGLALDVCRCYGDVITIGIPGDDRRSTTMIDRDVIED
jgi:hypothetical protein